MQVRRTPLITFILCSAADELPPQQPPTTIKPRTSTASLLQTPTASTHYNSPILSSLTLNTEAALHRQVLSFHRAGYHSGMQTASELTTSSKPREGRNGIRRCGKEDHHQAALDITRVTAMPCHLDYHISKVMMNTNVRIMAMSVLKRRKAPAWGR